MNNEQPSFVFILPKIQTYSWGYCGTDSLAGYMWKQSRIALKKSCSHVHESDPILSEDIPYAELWYGAHTNGMNSVFYPNSFNENPSIIKKNGEDLDTFIKSQLNFNNVDNTHNSNNTSLPLPYLLKVLSNRTALSIQCHPDKQTAEMLFQTNPSLYTDANHKPEISLALRDKVESLCGFRSWKDIAQIVQLIPEIKHLLSTDWLLTHNTFILHPERLTTDEESSCLKFIFSQIMIFSDRNTIQNCIKDLCNKKIDYSTNISFPSFLIVALKIFYRLTDEYPMDPGCFAPFFLNYIQTQPGECLFIKPNTLHTYLNGQIIECMACSDNVVRGGLTPKFKDLNLLKNILDYTPYSAPLITPVLIEAFPSSTCNTVAAKILLYDPKLYDFRLYLIHLPPCTSIQKPFRFNGESPTILLVLQGRAIMDVVTDNAVMPSKSQEMFQGHSVLLSKNCTITLYNNCEETLNLFCDEKMTRKPSFLPPIEFDDILRGSGNSNFLAVAVVGGSMLTDTLN